MLLVIIKCLLRKPIKKDYILQDVSARKPMNDIVLEDVETSRENTFERGTPLRGMPITQIVDVAFGMHECRTETKQIKYDIEELSIPGLATQVLQL